MSSCGDTGKLSSRTRQSLYAAQSKLLIPLSVEILMMYDAGVGINTELTASRLLPRCPDFESGPSSLETLLLGFSL